MTEKERVSLNFEKYQYGGLAARLLQSEESSRYVPGALEMLAGKDGLNLGEEALGFIRGTYASEDGIKTAIGIYNQKFEEKRGKYIPLELATWYDSILSDLDEKDKEKILNALGEHKETIGYITKKVQRAAYVVNSEKSESLKDLFNESQISEARKILEKYQGIMGILQMLDNYKFEQLRPYVVAETRKKELKDLVKRLEK